jgi:hypothetical protein
VGSGAWPAGTAPESWAAWTHGAPTIKAAQTVAVPSAVRPVMLRSSNYAGSEANADLRASVAIRPTAHRRQKIANSFLFEEMFAFF